MEKKNILKLTTWPVSVIEITEAIIGVVCGSCSSFKRVQYT